MSAKPNITLARWADTVSAVVVDPTSGLRDTGFVDNTPIEEGFVNALIKQLYLWALYLSEGALSGNHSIAGTLEVAGALTCDVAATITGLCTMSNNLIVAGNITGHGPLSVDGTSQLTGAVTAGTDVTAGGNITAGGLLMAFTDFTYTADSTTDQCTAANHPLHTGTGPIRTSNSGGALPGGLTAGVDIFAIKIDANTFKLATSLANAVAGIAIDITSNGTGTQTINHQSLTARIADVHATRNVIVDNNATIAGNASVAGILTAGTLTTGASQVGLITPTLASGNNNNFNPTGASGATAMIVGATATSAITGMSGGVNGRLMWIMNDSAFNVTITHNDSNSSAGNRFLNPGGTTITLTANASNATLWIYESSANSWRLLGKNF